MGQSPDGKTYNQVGDGLPFMQGSAEFGEHHPIPQKWCSEPKKIAEVGDLLLSVRAPVGDTNFANQRIAIGRGLSIVRARPNSLNSFIRLVVQQNISELIASSGSGMFASITGKNLKEFRVNLPPLVEQKRIVDLISSIDAYIGALRKQHDSSKAARGAFIFKSLSTSEANWVELRLGDLTKCAGGCAFPEAHQGFQEGTPFIKVSDMNVEGNEKYIHAANNYVSSAAIDKLRLRVWPQGTVVFPKVGAALLTEKRRILTTDTIFDNNLMGLVPSERILSEYLYLILLQIRFSDVVQPGVVPSINNSIVEDMVVSIPPLEKQSQIVAEICSFDDFISQLAHNLKTLKALRSALLADLLGGFHTIPENYDNFMDENE